MESVFSRESFNREFCERVSEAFALRVISGVIALATLANSGQSANAAAKRTSG
jgi:hypothetical protein